MATADRRSMLEAGTSVAWTSQAGGSWKEKAGEVLAFLPAGQDARQVMERLGLRCRLMAQPVSRFDRYLVRVQVGPRAVRLYAPKADMLEFWGHHEPSR